MFWQGELKSEERAPHPWKGPKGLSTPSAGDNAGYSQELQSCEGGVEHSRSKTRIRPCVLEIGRQLSLPLAQVIDQSAQLLIRGMHQADRATKKGVSFVPRQAGRQRIAHLYIHFNTLPISTDSFRCSAR